MFSLVLISGKQGSGKTTTALQLKEESLRAGFEIFSSLKFAGPLYELHDTILNKMQNWTGVPRVKKNGSLLQYLGTELGRAHFGENVWVNILKKQLEYFKGYQEKFNPTKNFLVVVDDCRFENEFDAFPEALRVRLYASEENRKPRTESWRENTGHPSETGLDRYVGENKFDLYIQTDAPESSPAHCAALIFAQLKKQNWIEKRGSL